MYWVTIIFFGVLALSLLVLLVRILLYASVLFFGAQFVASSDKRLAMMLQLAELSKNEKIIDLGSGDGKVLCAVAQQGYKIEGVELNSILVKKTRKILKQLELNSLVTVIQDSFWNISLSDYDVVFVYGNAFLMKPLQEKLQTDLKPGARVISNYFQFPDWQPTKSRQDIHLYRR